MLFPWEPRVITSPCNAQLPVFRLHRLELSQRQHWQRVEPRHRHGPRRRQRRPANIPVVRRRYAFGRAVIGDGLNRRHRCRKERGRRRPVHEGDMSNPGWNSRAGMDLCRREIDIPT